jgi:hypothetical protein
MKRLLAFLSLLYHFVITIRSAVAGMKRLLGFQKTVFCAMRILPYRHYETSQSMVVGRDGASGTDIGWRYVYSRQSGPLHRKLSRNNPLGETGKAA